MQRTYTSTANFRAPFDSVPFAGLETATKVQRTYGEVSNFRAPYDTGYYQSGALRGLGGVTFNPAHLLVPAPEQAPPAMQAYLVSGRPMGTARRDLGSALNQVPRWAYGVIGAVALYFAWRAYKQSPKSARAELEGARTEREPATMRSAGMASNRRRRRRR